MPATAASTRPGAVADVGGGSVTAGRGGATRGKVTMVKESPVTGVRASGTAFASGSASVVRPTTVIIASPTISAFRGASRRCNVLGARSVVLSSGRRFWIWI